MSSNFYKKLFICEIKDTLKDEVSESDIIRTLIKSRITGMITGIKKFSRKTVYSVDDGTGTMDCVLWHNNEPASLKRIDRCLNQLNLEHNGNATQGSDLGDICQTLLNKVHVNGEEFGYSHGDVISCLGHVKLVKRKLLLDMNYHYKADNVNAETLWILDALFHHPHR